MKTMKIKAYDAVISCDWLGDGASVLLGVVQDESEHENWWDHDSWADEKIYYYLTEEEMKALKVGDVLNDGEDFKILEIDKDEPTIYEVKYEEEV